MHIYPILDTAHVWLSTTGRAGSQPPTQVPIDVMLLMQAADDHK